MAGKHTQGKAKPSGWDRYDAVMNAGGAALVLLVLAVGAVLLGLACIRWARVRSLRTIQIYSHARSYAIILPMAA